MWQILTRKWLNINVAYHGEGELEITLTLSFNQITKINFIFHFKDYKVVYICLIGWLMSNSVIIHPYKMIVVTRCIYVKYRYSWFLETFSTRYPLLQAFSLISTEVHINAHASSDVVLYIPTYENVKLKDQRPWENKRYDNTENCISKLQCDYWYSSQVIMRT